MKAVVIARAGPPESLEVAERPDPSPGPGQVLIRVRRAGVNFADVLARQGLYPDAPHPPFVPGYEVSGTVEAAGPGVSGFRGGENVAAFTRFGGYAERAVADARFVVPLPPGVGFAAGAAIPVNYATAWHCLFDTGTVLPGDRVLIHAAAGGVGLASVRMAKGAGAVVFGTAGSEEKVRFLRDFGVDHPMDYKALDFAGEILKITGGEGVDVILDSIGGATIAKDFKILRPGGRIVFLGLASASGRGKALALAELVGMPRLQPVRLLEKSQAFVGVNILRLFDHRPAAAADLVRRCFRMAADGGALPVIASEIPLEKAADAHRMLQGRATVGKVLLTVAE